MEPMQGNTMHGAGGNNPMVHGDINAGDGANINLGITQLHIAVAERENWDTAIEYIVQGALDKAKSLQIGGVDLFCGAQNQLVKIEESLVDINDFIIIAERSPKKDPKLMKLLEKLKDAAYEAQDLMEEYEIADRRRSEGAENRVPAVHTSVTMERKYFKLRERLEAIKAECHTFQLKEKVTNLGTDVWKDRETYPFVHESQVLGREDENMKIVNLLLSTELDHVSAISIVGMGGLGKTTLAQSVFNDDAVQNHFDPKIWICVSDYLVPDNFDIKQLGNKILAGATRVDCNLSNLVELQRRLQEELGGKRFLLVLDDVWNEQASKWHGTNGLRGLLLCGGKESRIVVTTRSGNVASIMSKIQQQYFLKPLSGDVCWSLFCQHAFAIPTEETARSKLEQIGRQIVEKCKGNPLAVTTVRGLLLGKITESSWESVRDSEMWSLPEETENGILPALRLSYNYLRPHLKQCFAFCAIFPQDYKIEKELVIKLWMAHDFIPTDPEGLMELEDTGKEIFNELVMRSFFQNVKENVTIHKPTRRDHPFVYIPNRTTFQMHDLMHDLAHSVMKNEYRSVLNGKPKDISPRIRHVSSNGLGILAASLPKAQMLRTYVMLEQADCQFPCDVGLFKRLRALDFMWQDKQEVEKQLLTSLGNLQHLRYLDLSFTSIEMLPETLTSLCYLQTLILMGCTKLCELPKEMCKLTNLRCLDINDCDKLTHMPPKMGQLSCLQELSNFIVGRTNEIACSGIGELHDLNLRGRLNIQLLKNTIDVPRGTLINKPNLTSLGLMWGRSNVEFGTSEEERKREVLEQQVLQGLQPHRNLKELAINDCRGLNFPSWMMDTTLTELVKITLSRCWRCKHLPPLGELPLLRVLTIHELENVECIGNEFYGKEVSGGFRSLERLHITWMQKLKKWSGPEWKGERVFPSLINLRIWNCPRLTTTEIFRDNQSSFADEDKIRSQSSLQVLEIHYCNKLKFSGLGLRHLSSLEHLSIWSSNEFAHVADELSFLTSLQYLQLEYCHGLKSLPEGIGNLTSLRILYISYCPEMASLPRELQHLSALKELVIYRCHPSLEIRCTKDTGEDWENIQHISRITINKRDVRKTQVRTGTRSNTSLKSLLGVILSQEINNGG